MSKTFSKISTKNFDVSFSSTFFVLSRFRVFLSDGSSKTLPKTFCKTNRVEKFLQKIRPKIQNRLFLEFCLSRFWAFLDEGSSNPPLTYPARPWFLQKAREFPPRGLGGASRTNSPKTAKKRPPSLPKRPPSLPPPQDPGDLPPVCTDNRPPAHAHTHIRGRGGRVPGPETRFSCLPPCARPTPPPSAHTRHPGGRRGGELSQPVL
jgi:hypothetical protein